MSIRFENTYLIIYEEEENFVDTYEEFLNIFSPSYIETINDKEEYLLGVIKILALIEGFPIDDIKDFVIYSTNKNNCNLIKLNEQTFIKSINDLGIAKIEAVHKNI